MVTNNVYMLPYDSADKNVGIKQSQGTMACIQPLPLEKKKSPSQL